MEHRTRKFPSGSVGRAARISRRSLIGQLPLLLAGGVTRSYAQALRNGIFDTADPDLEPGSPNDQSAIFRRALEKAATDGRPLFLAPGRYEIADIDMPAYIHLIGVPDQTRLVFRGGGFLLKARGAKTLRIEGVTLDGNALPLDGESSGLLDADTIDEVVVDDCTILASLSSGLLLRQASGRVTDCNVEGVRRVGIDIDQSQGGMEVTGNRVTDCGDTGILVERDAEGEDGSIVSGNRVTGIRADSGGNGQYGNGINLDKANGVVISGNRIDHCAFSAIRCYSSDGIAVTSNIATHSGETGLYVEFAFEGVIVADNLIDGATDGISFANFKDDGGRLGACSGNVVRHISGGAPNSDGTLPPGAGIAAEADIAITGNVIEDAVWGLQLGWGPYLRDLSATGNVIRRTRIGIAVSAVEGGGPALVAGNVISEAEQGAILGMRWEEVATGELQGGKATLPGISVSDNQIS